MARPKTYTGTDIEIAFDLKRCIHARNCFLKLPEVFDPGRRPWVDPDAVPAEEIAAMIRTCPSGALTFRRLDGGVDERATRVNRVQVLENGPLAIQGDLDVAGEPMQRATLCRCGKTGNAPFCDYSHVKAAFTATGEPEGEDPTGTYDGPAGLKLTPIPNGPIRTEGPMEVTTGTGHRVAIKDRAILCRCGQSKNKPFCDGSHKAAGFEAS